MPSLRAVELYEQGVDVIVSAAGSSDFGTFAAAAQYSAGTGAQVWAIGLDNDQRFAVPASLQSMIATSIIKRVDVGAYRLVEYMLDGGEPGAAFRLGVADDISTQGDGLDEQHARRDPLRHRRRHRRCAHSIAVSVTCRTVTRRFGVVARSLHGRATDVPGSCHAHLETRPDVGDPSEALRTNLLVPSAEHHRAPCVLKRAADVARRD